MFVCICPHCNNSKTPLAVVEDPRTRAPNVFTLVWVTCKLKITTLQITLSITSIRKTILKFSHSQFSLSYALSPLLNQLTMNIYSFSYTHIFPRLNQTIMPLLSKFKSALLSHPPPHSPPVHRRPGEAQQLITTRSWAIIFIPSPPQASTMNVDHQRLIFFTRQ